jgi:hypothetical protein
MISSTAIYRHLSWIVPTHPQDDLLYHFGNLFRAERLANRTAVHEEHPGLHTLVVPGRRTA